MASKRRPYKTYPVEFKLEAIRIMEESDRPAAEIAREIIGGIPGTVYLFQSFRVLRIN